VFSGFVHLCLYHGTYNTDVGWQNEFVAKIVGASRARAGSGKMLEGLQQERLEKLGRRRRVPVWQRSPLLLASIHGTFSCGDAVLFENSSLVTGGPG